MVEFLRRGDTMSGGSAEPSLQAPPRPPSSASHVSFPVPFYATLAHDTAATLTHSVCEVLSRVCPALCSRLSSMGSHATVVFGPMVRRPCWTSLQNCALRHS